VIEGLAINPRWLDGVDELRAEFSSATPFPIVVLDDFLDEGLAHALFEQFPDVNEMPRSRDYVFGQKRELSNLSRGGPPGEQFFELTTSPAFAKFLSGVAGVEVFVDADFHGGGFHQGADGSYLDTHVDFNIHPLHPDWLRTLNVLVYLNPEWKDEWGGELLVRSAPDAPERSIEPRFNRAVIMLTDDRTYHGYRQMHLPNGVTRKSIATYAYQQIDKGSVVARTTGWAPEGAPPWKRFLARHYGTLVRAKNRVFGSGTAKNR
jgi:hypothetical protein